MMISGLYSHIAIIEKYKNMRLSGTLSCLQERGY